MLHIHDFAPSEVNPRNSEGTFYRRGDGRIGFIYSRFTTGSDDYSRSDLTEAILTADGTAYTGESRVLFRTEDFGAQNIMCPSIADMPDGRLLLFFDVRMGDAHLNPYLYESFDRGETFVNGRNLINKTCYMASENDRVLMTGRGTLIYWLFHSEPQEGCYAGISPHCCARYLRSVDGGATWTLSPRYDRPELYSGLQEAGTVETADGSLLAWARTDAGCQYTARSHDDGEHYSSFEPDANFPSPLSPMSMKTLSDGRILAVYNPVPLSREDRERDFGLLWRRRAPLVYRTGRDGKTWNEPVQLEPYSDTANYCYTGIFAEKDFVLLAYCASDPQRDGGGLNRLRIVRLEMSEIK